MKQQIQNVARAFRVNSRRKWIFSTYIILMFFILIVLGSGLGIFFNNFLDYLKGLPSYFVPFLVPGSLFGLEVIPEGGGTEIYQITPDLTLSGAVDIYSPNIFISITLLVFSIVTIIALVLLPIFLIIFFILMFRKPVRDKMGIFEKIFALPLVIFLFFALAATAVATALIGHFSTDSLGKILTLSESRTNLFFDQYDQKLTAFDQMIAQMKADNRSGNFTINFFYVDLNGDTKTITFDNIPSNAVSISQIGTALEGFRDNIADRMTEALKFFGIDFNINEIFDDPRGYALASIPNSQKLVDIVPILALTAGSSIVVIPTASLIIAKIRKKK